MTHKKIIRVMVLLLGVFLLINFTNGYEGIIECRSNGESEDTNVTVVSEALKEYGIQNTEIEYRITSKEEDFYTEIFHTRDGANLAYIFDEPVKYFDKEGIVKDKSNTLYKLENDSQYLCANLKNDIVTFFPSTIDTNIGIKITHNTECIEMIPECKETCSAGIFKNTEVYYSNVFEDGVDIEYRPTFSGFKETIVLNRPDMSKFSFIVNTHGLMVEKRNNLILFERKGIVIAVINPIFVFDSAFGNKNNKGIHFSDSNTVEIEKISDNTYRMVICIDEEFLNGEDTVFPVYVDPTTEVITSTGSGSNKTILDTPIYNGSGVSGMTAGSNVSGVVGYVNSTYGTGRMLIRFPGLMNKSFMGTNYTIMNSFLTLTDLSGHTGTIPIVAYNYTGPSWNETSTYNSSIWNGMGNSIGAFLFSYPSSTEVSLNITTAVKNWQINPSQGEKGLILKNGRSETDANYYASIATSEYSSSKPYLSVKYFFNGCKSPKSTSNNNINCLGYAFYVNGYDIMSYFNNAEYTLYSSNNANNVNSAVVSAMSRWLNSNFSGRWDYRNSYSHNIEQNQWMVCMRTGLQYIDNGFSSGYERGYHFWYRASNGKWYNKHGWLGSSEVVPNIVNPSIASGSSGWTLPGMGGAPDLVDFYSSNTTYYMIEES